MKLATVFGTKGPRVCAVVQHDTAVLDLQAAHQLLESKSSPYLTSMLALIESGRAGLELARRVLDKAASRISAEPLNTVTLLAPVPEPVQMRDALCFELHCVQAFQKARELRASLSSNPQAALRDMEERGILSVPKEFYEVPLYYKQNRFSVAAPETDVIWPVYSKVMDYELEFGVFIGRSGINIKRDNALDHVFGYTIFNDLSARDTQFMEQNGNLGPAKGKDFKNGNPMGPWIVTADELSNPYQLEMVVRVNGEERGRGNSSSMFWRFEDVIARISDCEEIRAGEFVGSGTVGNGCGLESMTFLKDGDLIELEVQGIGTLRNRVFAAKPSSHEVVGE